MRSIFNSHFLRISIPTILIAAIVAGCNDSRRDIQLSDSVPEIDNTREAKILTALFGLDNALPPRSRAHILEDPRYLGPRSEGAEK